MLKYILPLLLLYSQDPATLDPEDELAIAREHLKPWPRTLLITVRAQYADGQPARGHISCDGSWCKFDEDQYCGLNLPFATDSRGACVFNPSFEYQEDGMVCYATAGLRSSGMLAFTPYDHGVFIITIPGKSPDSKK